MRIVILLVAVLVSFALPARADDVANAQSVIRAQEQAFSRDDAATAYSYAAPGIHDAFPQADIFMSMVQNAYTPVYRHKTFEFGEAQSVGGQVAQSVHIVDDKGEAWDALYTLEQQGDGSLKIVGCVLRKAGQSVYMRQRARIGAATPASAFTELPRARTHSPTTMTIFSAFQASPLAKAAA